MLTGKAYVCQEATDRLGQAIPLLFRVEIATGLTDNLIEKIIIRSHSLDSVSQLLCLGATSVRSSSQSHFSHYFFCTLTYLCHSINMIDMIKFKVIMLYNINY